MGHILPHAEIPYKCIWINYFSLLLGITDQNTFLTLLLLSSNSKIAVWLVTKVYFTAISPPFAPAPYCLAQVPVTDQVKSHGPSRCGRWSPATIQHPAASESRKGTWALQAPE